MAHRIGDGQHDRMPITLPTRMVTATGDIEGAMENISLQGPLNCYNHQCGDLPLQRLEHVIDYLD